MVIYATTRMQTDKILPYKLSEKAGKYSQTSKEHLLNKKKINTLQEKFRKFRQINKIRPKNNREQDSRPSMYKWIDNHRKLISLFLPQLHRKFRDVDQRRTHTFEQHMMSKYRTFSVKLLWWIVQQGGNDVSTNGDF